MSGWKVDRNSTLHQVLALIAYAGWIGLILAAGVGLTLHLILGGPIVPV